MSARMQFSCDSLQSEIDVPLFLLLQPLTLARIPSAALPLPALAVSRHGKITLGNLFARDATRESEQTSN